MMNLMRYAGSIDGVLAQLQRIEQGITYLVKREHERETEQLANKAAFEAMRERIERETGKAQELANNA